MERSTILKLTFPTLSFLVLMAAIAITPQPVVADPDPDCDNEYCDTDGWNTCEDLAHWNCTGVFHCDPSNDSFCPTPQ